jgi:hypothetical protein
MRECPQPLEGEVIINSPVEIKPKTHRDKLVPESRVNYAKVYTIEHNVKVWFIGKIEKQNLNRFIKAFDNIYCNG